MDGVLRCSRYSFGPNRLHYCGPDRNREMLQYLRADASDPGLRGMLEQFSTLYPYLQRIAQSNRIPDPFDERVVEAYWIGNDLLENVSRQSFFEHLRDGVRLKDRMKGKEFDRLGDKIRLGALPHHSFHVLDVWLRTGHVEREHTIESMDNCRISWGTVAHVAGPNITLMSEPLRYENGKLSLSAPEKKTVIRALDAPPDLEQLEPGNIITLHWNVPCEVITPAQAAALRKYTIRHLQLANLTL
ncbi:MAG: DUF6390 family protein [Patescibacteria group bacterium]|nr:DUF6390 family protein [Patescibacteria group bacterium]